VIIAKCIHSNSCLHAIAQAPLIVLENFWRTRSTIDYISIKYESFDHNFGKWAWGKINRFTTALKLEEDNYNLQVLNFGQQMTPETLLECHQECMEKTRYQDERMKMLLFLRS